MRIMKTMPVAVAIYREGESPIYGEQTITVTLEDEAGGAFVSIKSNDEHQKEGELTIDVSDLELAAKVARQMADAYDAAMENCGEGGDE